MRCQTGICHASKQRFGEGICRIHGKPVCHGAGVPSPTDHESQGDLWADAATAQGITRFHESSVLEYNQRLRPADEQARRNGDTFTFPGRRNHGEVTPRRWVASKSLALSLSGMITTWVKPSS